MLANGYGLPQLVLSTYLKSGLPLPPASVIVNNSDFCLAGGSFIILGKPHCISVAVYLNITRRRRVSKLMSLARKRGITWSPKFAYETDMVYHGRWCW